MNFHNSIPWDRYALIAELTKKMESPSHQFGKTALQKVIYFLQELYGVNCGYDFTIYSYGPFDSQILADLDIVEQFGCIQINTVLSGTGGYSIVPTPSVDSIRAKASSFLNATTTIEAIDAVISNYGNKTAKELELRATIFYVYKDLKKSADRPSTQSIQEIVHSIKPKFSSADIYDAISEMITNEHICCPN
jgi:uncharacterized protein YwgA